MRKNKHVLPVSSDVELSYACITPVAMATSNVDLNDFCIPTQPTYKEEPAFIFPVGGIRREGREGEEMGGEGGKR